MPLRNLFIDHFSLSFFLWLRLCAFLHSSLRLKLYQRHRSLSLMFAASSTMESTFLWIIPPLSRHTMLCKKSSANNFSIFCCSIRDILPGCSCCLFLDMMSITCKFWCRCKNHVTIASRHCTIDRNLMFSMLSHLHSPFVQNVCESCPPCFCFETFQAGMYRQ